MDLPLEPIGVPPRPENEDGATTVFVCDRIEPMLGSHLDHELSRAEHQQVEDHLDACPRCRARREHLEVLSGALKGWEANTLTPVLPDLRLRNAVLSRVAETSHQRRVDGRVLRIMHAAVAACVILALGLGIFLGAQHETPVHAVQPADGRVVSYGVVSDVIPLDVGRALELDAEAWTPSSDLTDLGQVPVSAPIQPLPRLGPAQDAMVRIAMANGTLQARRDAIAVVTGEEPMSVPGMDGGVVFVPRTLAGSPSFEHARRLLVGERAAPAEPASVPPKPLDPPLVPFTTEGKATDRTVASLLEPLSLLDVQKDAGSAEKDTGRNARNRRVRAGEGPVMHWPPDRGAARDRSRRVIEVWPLPDQDRARHPRLSSTDGGGHRYVDVLDPVGLAGLTLADDPTTREGLVITVQGTNAPVYIPAGQIVQGGVNDRVTAEALWIPAAPKRLLRFRMRCYSIRKGPDRAVVANPPRFAPWIVGPSLRSLIAHGTTTSEFLTAVARQYDATGSERQGDGGFSLLDVFENRDRGAVASSLRVSKSLAHKIPDFAKTAGFLFTDGQDRVAGLEVVRFKGKARASLLARLWAGYYFEALIRQGELGTEHPSVAMPVVKRSVAVAGIRASDQAMMGRLDENFVRTSSTTLSDIGLSFLALEQGRKIRAGKQGAPDRLDFIPVHIGGFPRLAPAPR